MLPQLLELLDATAAPSQAPVGIYLPSVLYIVKELVSNNQQYKNLYKIEFICKDELSENLLWSGTQMISAETMRYLGKQINQEKVYCIFKIGAVRANGNDNDDIYRLLETIKDMEVVRRIRLTPMQRPHISQALQYLLQRFNYDPRVCINYQLWKVALKKLKIFYGREQHCDVV